MSTATVNPYAVHAVVSGTNADLMDEVNKIYPLDYVTDLTYGDGKFWTKHRPEHLLTNDLYKPADTCFDFTRLPLAWGDVCDVVIFDPPYMSPGGRETSTVGQMNAAYGMHTTPKGPGRLWDELIEPGIREAVRVARPGGLVMVKCMDYISSRKLQAVFPKVMSLAPQLDVTVEDYFVLLSKPGPQPHTNKDGSPRRQEHARHSGVSFLVIFRKPA